MSGCVDTDHSLIKSLKKKNKKIKKLNQSIRNLQNISKLVSVWSDEK